ISNTIATTQSQEAINSLLQTPRNDPNFNAVNVYGDEVQVDVDLGNSTVPINRTGIREEDIVDYDVQTYRMSAGLHYRLTEDIEINYTYSYTQSDAILRHTTIYPLVNFNQQFHRGEIKGSNFNILGYYSRENAADSYAMLATGSFIEQGRKSNEAWGADYGAAFRGEVSGVTGGSHDAARIYADRDMPAVGSDAFNALRTATLTNPDISTGGSQFIDRTSFINILGNYNFTQIEDILEVQVGANYRRFRLDSEGQLFNDGPLGFNAPIPIDEYGFFVQLGKKLFNDRLKLRASLRYDKNQNFEGRVTPRASAVFSLDPDKRHNLRASFQTGFRNPATQETYIALDIGSAILLGGTEDNIDNYSYDLGDGTIVQGRDIFDGLVTPASFGAFAATGFTDPSVLELSNLDFIKQERNNTFEVGYKGLFGDKLFIDLSYYYTVYSDFVVRLTTISPSTGRAFLVYTNVDDDITSQGVGLSLEYSLPGNFKIGGNYTYTQFDADEAVANEPGFLPSFNTPENRFNLSFSNADIASTNFGFNLKYRWSQDYTWQSPFGAGEIPGFGIVDLALSYKFDKLKSSLKLGASNLFNNEYRTVYGGPNIGSIYYVSWTYDQIFR
ncbi:MAG: TonB-dependent receptor, partial [Bacteroidota bacterium]